MQGARDITASGSKTPRCVPIARWGEVALTSTARSDETRSSNVAAGREGETEPKPRICQRHDCGVLPRREYWVTREQRRAVKGKGTDLELLLYTTHSFPLHYTLLSSLHPLHVPSQPLWEGRDQWLLSQRLC